MNPLEHLSRVPSDQWPQLRRRALAQWLWLRAGSRVRARGRREELVALTLPGLPSLGVLAMLTECGSEPGCECMRALSHDAAGMLRLVDGALAADGRDHDYPAAVWLERAFADAHECAQGAARSTFDELPAATLVEAVAEAPADVIMALHRDRIGVPEGLADALGSLLVLYAAGMAKSG